ncbi:MAG: hypothetical protein NTW21_29355 [Verrucomicrobia bacterium]|nr:hypothetical protein [Verrucomicrobiota bacterium]
MNRQIAPNLFDMVFGGGPFQIDGNFGYTAGVCEMLLQSHNNEIALLPALPKAWSNGSIKGLLARGGFEVDMTWEEGMVVTLTHKSTLGKPRRIRSASPLTLDNLKQMTDVPRFLVLAEPANQQQWPCFILAPQCPENQQWAAMPWSEPTGVGKFTSITWPLEASLALVDSLPPEYRGIDVSRLYVTGISMGGYGTWDAVCRVPKKFKAAVPICGGGDPVKIAQMTDLRNLRVRAYHSADDRAVPVGRTREMIDALKALQGIQPRYTEFPDGGRDAYTRAYADPALLPWLFAGDVLVGETCYEGHLQQGFGTVQRHVYYFDPATGREFDQGTVKATAKAGDKDAKPVSFKKNVPSPQDWVLVFERVK